MQQATAMGTSKIAYGLEIAELRWGADFLNSKINRGILLRVLVGQNLGFFFAGLILSRSPEKCKEL